MFFPCSEGPEDYPTTMIMKMDTHAPLFMKTMLLNYINSIKKPPQIYSTTYYILQSITSAAGFTKKKNFLFYRIVKLFYEAKIVFFPWTAYKFWFSSDQSKSNNQNEPTISTKSLLLFLVLYHRKDIPDNPFRPPLSQFIDSQTEVNEKESKTNLHISFSKLYEVICKLRIVNYSIYSKLLLKKF